MTQTKEKKKCAACGKNKHVTAFGVRKKPEGVRLQDWCKECRGKRWSRARIDTEKSAPRIHQSEIAFYKDVPTMPEFKKGIKTTEVYATSTQRGQSYESFKAELNRKLIKVLYQKRYPNDKTTSRSINFMKTKLIRKGVLTA